MGYLYNFILQVFCIVWVLTKINNKHELYKQSYNSVGRSLYVFFALVFAYSLYTGFGGDDQRYRDFVEGGYENFYILDFFSIEELYVLIAKYTKSFILWKIVVYGSSVFLSIWAIKRMKVDNLLTLFVFSLIPMSSYGSTRAVLAYSIFLLGYTFISEKKIYKQLLGLLLVFLSWRAHSSMILPILLTPLTYLKITKVRIYILIALFPIMVMLFNKYYVVFFASSAIGDTMAAGKFDVYNDTGAGAGTDVSTVGSILRFLFGFVVIPPIFVAIKGVYTKTIDEKFYKLYKLLFLMLYVCFVIYFSNLNNATFFNRYFTMIPFYLYLVISGISLEKNITPYIRKTYMNYVLVYSSVSLMYDLYCFYLV